ncbi:MAG: type II secretion system F family protein [Bacteroidota bacterium]
MPTFVYEARDRSGGTSAGTLDAESTSAAVAKLREAGLFITSLKQQQEASSPEVKMSLGGKVKLRDISILTRQWAVMIRAGLNLISCLRTLTAQTANAVLKNTILQVRKDVEAGQALAGALSKHSKIFNTMFVHMVEAGEASGQLDTVFERLADYNERQYALRRKIIGSLTYPAVIVLVVFGVATFLITYIVPQFAAVFTSFGKPLPGVTAFVVNISNLLRSPAFIIPFLAVVGLSIFGLAQWRKTPGGKYQIDRFILKLPVFGPLVQKIAVSRFVRTFGTLIESGISVVPAMEIVERAVGNAVISKALGEARISISQGQGMAKPLQQTGAFPPMLSEMVAIGEETGALEKVLAQMADFYDSEVETAVENLTSMIEPMVMILLGGIVGFIVVAIFIPMLDMANVMA